MPRAHVWFPLLFCAAIACKGSQSEESAAGPDPAPKSESDEAAPSMSMPPMAKLFTSGLSKPGPYEAPRQSDNYADGSPYYAVMDLGGSIAELESFDLLGGTATKPLRSILDAIDKVAKDEQAKGIALRVSGPSLSFATAEELRGALIAFKAEGKRSVTCHAESIANAQYVVMSACDSIALAPLGQVMVSGSAATPVHVKGLLDRLGVVADFLHIGAFKGAAEPLTREAPSDEMRKTLGEIVDQGHDGLVSAIAQGRGLDPDTASTLVDEALFIGERAVEVKLVDRIETWEATLGGLDAAWKVHKKSVNPMADFGALQRFLGMAPPDRPTDPHVAVVYAVGNIIDGKGSGILGAREEVASHTLVPAIRALARDDKVKAVVLRIDSPGGSALASEQIWVALEELAASKPLVASMASVAASGGYYIASPAKKIYAQPNTLTGSIGVVGGKVVVGGALDKVGITTFDVHRGARAAMWSVMTPWTDDEREVVRTMMKDTYDRFVDRVTAGRKMERDAVLAVAQGRVWTGAKARENGLVDDVGGLAAAVAHARELGGVDEGVGLEVYPPEPTLRDIISSLGAVQAPSRMASLVEATTETLVGSMAAGADRQALARAQWLVATLVALSETKVWAMEWVAPL